MAAISAAECGANVILIEQNSVAGKKLLATGRGRCNITHTGEIADFVNVDKSKVGQDQPDNLKAKNDHVYLLHHEMWKRWALFKLTTK